MSADLAGRAGTSEYPYCAFCETPLAEHPEPLCSPGIVRDLQAKLTETERQIGHYKTALDYWQRNYERVAEQLWASCICDPNPETTEGMLEDCPVHGTEEHRPLALKAAIERVRSMARVWIDANPTYPTMTDEGRAVAYAGEQVIAALEAGQR